MRKIILVSLFFCLAITTVLAQVATINIATPNSNGLSNNQVADFDVNADGTILNNSAVDGTAQLGNTAVTGNSNITAGSEADLILFQVNGSSGSDLNGAIEVFGEEAGLIIANPNGIVCDGCGFINTSKVDLVTGTANFSGDDLTGFSIDDTSKLNVNGNGFVSDAVADELNLVSRYLRINAQAKANTTLRVLSGNETYDHTTNIINSDDTETSSSHSIWISGTLEANYIELINTELDTDGVYGIVNFGEDISADRLKIDSNGLFRNQNDGTNDGSINISGLFEVTNAKKFTNDANITAEILSITTNEFSNNDDGSTQLGNIVVTDTFSLSTPNASYTNTGTVSSDSLNLTIGGDFDYVADYLNNGTITTNALNLNVGGDFSYDDSANDFDWGANDTLTVSGSAFFNVYEFYNRGQIDVADNFNVTAGYDFNNYETINADNFNVTAGSYFYNEDSATINANNFNVTAGEEFYNYENATINADSFNVTVGDDFFNLYGATINADSFNVTVGDDFFNRYGATINANDFNVTLTSYYGDFYNQDGPTINADTVTIEVTNFANDIFNTGTVSSDSLNLILTDNFSTNGTSFNNFTFNNLAITTEGYYANYANLTVNNFNVTAAGDFYNYATINADSFNVTAGDDFYNYYTATTINANDFNVTAGDDFYNTYNATINADNFNVTVEDGFRNEDNATINADSFNVTAGDDFSNWDSATIEAGNFNVTAGDDFSNYDYATINANDFNVTTDYRFYNQSNSTINADNFNVTAGDNFYYSGDLDFELTANDSLTVLGDAFVDVTNFNNHGAVVADSLRITVENFATNIYNTGTISADSLNLILTDDFIHQSISFNGFSFNNLGINTGGDFTNRHALNVSDALTITVADFDANISNDSTISSDSLNLITSSNFTLLSNAFDDFTFNSLAITANNYTQGADIDIAGDISIQISGEASLDYNVSIQSRNLFFSAYNLYNQADLTITDSATFNIRNDFGNGFRFDGTDYAGGFIIAGNFNVTAGNDFLNRETRGATISADSFNVTAGGSFTNQQEARIIADSFNVTVGDIFLNEFYATISADTVTIEVTNFDDDIYNIATISSASLNIILTDDFVYRSYYFSRFNNFSNLAITTAGNYTQGANIDISGDLRIQASGEASLGDNASIKARNLFFSAYDLSNQADITITENATFEIENDFLNGFRLSGTDYDGGDIIVGSFNVTAGNNFVNRNNATIDADDFNVTAGGHFRNLGSGTINADSFNVTTGTYFGNEVAGTINANDFNVTTTGNFTNEYGGDIISGSFNVTTGTYFSNNNSGKINADNFNVTTEKDFANQSSSTINANDFNVAAGADFENDAAINADTVTIEVTNFADDIFNTATVSSDSLNFILTDDFTRSSTSFSGFTFNNLGIITDGSFTNEADLTVNNFNVTADSYFSNRGDLTVNNFNVTGSFSNRDGATINADSFNVTAGTTFSNTSGATINADSFNVTATNFVNSSTSNINADNFNVTAGDWFYNIFSATINANNFNVATRYGFYNYGEANINADNFNVTAGEDFDNRDSGTTINAENFNVIVTGDFTNQSSVIDAGIVLITTASNFNNSGSINADILDIALNDATGSFTNTGSASADTFTLSVASDFDYVADYLNGTITTNAFNLNVGGDFSNNDSANDFTWGANDSLTVSGSASIDAADFKNNGVFNVGDLNITAAGDFDNYATIDADNFNVTAVDAFNNRSDAIISADSFDATAHDFFNRSDAIITANECNIIHTNFYIDQGTINCDYEAEIEVIDIARPDVNGLSNNSYTDFNILNSGIVLNNSDSAGTSQLAGDISANTNYISGDAASIILNQVTGSNISSLLEGTLEVFGAEAVVIIANPSGITCNACSFINASRVDLVTGSNYNVATDSFNDIANTNIALIDNGFDASSVGILNIQAGSFTNTGGLKANTFNLSVAGDFDYTNRGTVATNAFNLNVGGDFSNNDANNDFTWGANDTLTVLGTASVVVDSFNNSGTINISNSSFDITATDFTNSGTISTNTTLNTTVSSTVSGSFDNTGGVVNADTFSLSVAGDFDYVAEYLGNGTITTNAFNLNVGGNFTNNDAANDFTWDENDSLTVLGTASVVADSFNNSGTINITNSSFDITATDFTNSGTISANTTLNTTVSSTANNSFTNTGGVLNTTAFALSVAGDFDYVAEYLGNGTITTNTLNLNVGGDFSNNDAANDFTWNASDSLTVLGTASITADNFTNFGYIDIANSFNVTAGADFFNRDSATINANDFNVTAGTYFHNVYSATINADSFNVTAGGSFTNQDEARIIADSFNVTVGDIFLNEFYATINANDFNVTASFFTNGYNAIINANDFNVTAGSNFYNSNGATINADNFNVTAGYWFYNEYSATISADNFNVTAAEMFNNYNSATINVDNFNVTTGGPFYNNYYSTISADNFNVSAAFDFYNFFSTINADNFSVTTEGDFYNLGSTTIDANDFNVTANNFFNTEASVEDGNISADTFSLSVKGDFDYSSDYLNNGNIDATALNLNVGGDFSNNDASNDFTWGANNTLTVLGNADITADSYTQNGAIDVAGVLTINVASDFDYVADFDGTIDFNSINLNVGGDFSNNDSANDFTWGANDNLTVLGSANIDADSYTQNGAIDVTGVLTINVASDFDYVADFDGTIDFNSINLNVGGDFSNNDSANDFTWGANDTLTVLGSADITADSYTQNGAIDVAGVLTINVASDFDYVADFDGTIDFNSINLNVGGDFSNNDSANDFTWGANDTLTVLGTASIDADSFNNSGTITITNNSLNISANTFSNTGGVLNADTVSLSVAGDFDYTKKGTITTNTINLNVDGDFSNNDANNGFTWGENDTLTVLGSASVTAASFENSGNITVTNNGFDITATDFTNSGTISANTTLNTTVSSTESGSFNNTGGVLNTDTFNLSVAGDFDYVADYLNNGTITTNALNLNVGGDFSNNDSANDFTWGENDTLTVLGTADITTDSFNNSGNITVTNNGFDITATDFTNSGTISANTTLNTTVSSTESGSFNNTGGVLNTDTFNLSVAGDFDYVADYLNNGTITTNAFNLNVGGDFSNNDSANDFTWGENDTLTVLGSADITTNNFANDGNISADTVSLSVAGDFDYTKKGTITTTGFNLTVGGDFSNNDSANDFTWTTNDSLTVLGDANITADEFDNSGTIIANALNLSVAGDFDYSSDFLNAGTIAADNLNFTARNGVFTNNATIDLADGNLGITANSFNNTEGVVNADTFALSVAGDFDDTNRGTITTNAFNLQVDGDFSNNDASDDFVLGENDNLSISGDFIIDTNNYIQFGTLVVDGALTIESDSDFSNSGNITVTGALAIDSDRNFVNHGGITTESLNITTGYTAINQGSIVSDSLAITANDFFRNLTGGDVDVATLNITAGGKVTNTANITVGTLNIIANNDSSRTNDTTGFYVANRGNITATTLNIAAVDNFYNRGNITATNFNITRAKAIFFLNKEIDSFYAAGHIYDGGDISLSGDASFTADGGIIENYGNIDLGDFNLDITANRFINQAGANVTANTLNLDVNSLIQHGFINAVINHQ